LSAQNQCTYALKYRGKPSVRALTGRIGQASQKCIEVSHAIKTCYRSFARLSRSVWVVWVTWRLGRRTGECLADRSRTRNSHPLGGHS
jgi:hypothetical protein